MGSQETLIQKTIQPPVVGKAHPEPPLEARRANWAQNLMGVAAIVALCYYGQQVLSVIFIAVLVSFVLAPIVDGMVFLRLPRAIAAGLALLVLLSILGGIVYVSYNEGLAFVETLPKYTTKIRDRAMKFRKQAESFEVLNPQHEKGVVSVRPATDWADVLSRGFGSITQVLAAASFIPFLAYFMLTTQGHVRSATVMLFPLQSRHAAYTTLGLISAMIRSFIVGNVLIGLVIGAASTVVFGILGLPFFYFVGFISGFLSLVPYLGIPLALAPPLVLAVGHLHAQETVYIASTVIGCHLIALNVLYPKFLGNRLRLNPLAVTISLLVWGMLWGAMGLLLAVPLTAAMKIIFDHVENLKPYGAWLGE